MALKVSLPQRDLARALATVGRGVGKAARRTLPITGHILLATEGERLRLSATDLEIGLTMRLPALIEQDGATTVPARLFGELIASLPDDRVDLAPGDESHATAVSCAHVRSTIRGLDPAEFPRIPTVEGPAIAAAPANLLRAMIGQVAFAAAADNARPVFTGVSATVADGTLTLAATDGYRIAVRSATLPQDRAALASAIGAIIPARTLVELGRILPESEEAVEVRVTEKGGHVLFHTGTLDLVSRVIEGQYVAYERIIPQTYAARAVVDVTEFKDAVRTARFFARDANNIVRLALEPDAGGAVGALTISAAAPDVGNNISQIDAALAGEPLAVAFDVGYIADALGGMTGAQVALELAGPAQPGVLRPLDDSAYQCVVMAMSTPT